MKIFGGGLKSVNTFWLKILWSVVTPFLYRNIMQIVLVLTQKCWFVIPF